MVKISLTKEEVKYLEQYLLIKDKIFSNEDVTLEERCFLDLYENDISIDFYLKCYKEMQEAQKKGDPIELYESQDEHNESQDVLKVRKKFLQEYLLIKEKEANNQPITDKEKEDRDDMEKYRYILYIPLLSQQLPDEEDEEKKRRKIQAALDRALTAKERDAAEEVMVSTNPTPLAVENAIAEERKEAEEDKEEADAHYDQKKKEAEEENEEVASVPALDLGNIEDLKTLFEKETGILRVSGVLGEEVDLTKEDAPNFKGVNFVAADLEKTKSISLPAVDGESFSFTAGDTIKPKLNFKEVHGVKNMDIKVDREGLKKITLPDNLKELKLTLPQKPSDDFELLGDWKNLEKLDLSECHEAMLTDEFLNKIKEENPKLKIILPQNSEGYQSENDDEIRITTQPVKKLSLINRLFNRGGR